MICSAAILPAPVGWDGGTQHCRSNTEITCEAPSLAPASAGSSRCWTAPSFLLHAKLTQELLGLLFSEALDHFIPQRRLADVLLVAPRQLGHVGFTGRGPGHHDVKPILFRPGHAWEIRSALLLANLHSPTLPSASLPCCPSNTRIRCARCSTRCEHGRRANARRSEASHLRRAS